MVTPDTQSGNPGILIDEDSPSDCAPTLQMALNTAH